MEYALIGFAGVALGRFSAGNDEEAFRFITIIVAAASTVGAIILRVNSIG